MVNRISAEHAANLETLLADWRATVCDSLNAMPYHILPSPALIAISRLVPTTSAALYEIDGMGALCVKASHESCIFLSKVVLTSSYTLGKTRVKKYGDAILNIVKQYLEKVG